MPDWPVKTTLQQTVQALKRHRDIYFTEALDLRPASIIITTLAAHAYRGSGGDLYEVLDDITDRMPGFVRLDGQRYIVANPVEPRENFADRWHGKPERAEAFFRWIEQAKTDFDGLAHAGGGLDTVISKMASMFGDRPAQEARPKPFTRHRGKPPPGPAQLRRRNGNPDCQRTPPEHGVSPRIMTSMATTARGRSLTMAQQALGLRSVFPDARLTLKPAGLSWTGRLQPCDLSRIYTVQITYSARTLPSRPGPRPRTHRRPRTDSCPTHTTTEPCACTTPGSGTQPC